MSREHYLPGYLQVNTVNLAECERCGALVSTFSDVMQNADGDYDVSWPSIERHNRWHEQLDKAKENADYAAGMMRPIA